MGKLKFPAIYDNWISLIGAGIAALAIVVMILFFIVGQLFEFAHNPYLGIIHFIIVPGIMVIGLILIPLGALVTRKRIERGLRGRIPAWPRVDLNMKSHRNAATVFALGSVLVIFVTAVGSYQALRYSESVEFCGRTCHEVMKPEFVAYVSSPHARVPCTACHIGEGASWFVKSKLSGAYQVYATLANTYPQPIPTPIENLRPAQETCERCHWPEKFFGAQQRRFHHYMYDEDNTHWPINMLIKTGGGDPVRGRAEGIHWHMNIGFEVEYIARDERRMDIPWMRVTELKTGRITIYEDKENPLTEEELTAAQPRKMDCMDCHNRPSHIFRSPDRAVDEALLTGHVDASLPFIKKVAVEAMAGEYATEKEARSAIATKIMTFYQARHPEVFRTRKDDIESSVLALQDIFSQNIFPEMRVRWSEYPSNLGHFTSPGCMRCHTERLVNDIGDYPTTECRTCHSILAQGSAERAMTASNPDEGLEFVHPEDIGEAWREMGCYECHTGAQP